MSNIFIVEGPPLVVLAKGNNHIGWDNDAKWVGISDFLNLLEGFFFLILLNLSCISHLKMAGKTRFKNN